MTEEFFKESYFKSGARGSRKVAGSSPGGGEFFQFTSSFQSHYGPGIDSEISTRNLPGGK
jgi:hypothetical protein